MAVASQVKATAPEEGDRGSVAPCARSLTATIRLSTRGPAPCRWVRPHRAVPRSRTSTRFASRPFRKERMPPAPAAQVKEGIPMSDIHSEFVAGLVAECEAGVVPRR